MKTSEEVIAEHTTDDGLDFEAAIEVFKESASKLELHPVEQMSLQEQHFAFMLRWLADLVLKGLNELNALPNGVEAERRNVATVMHFDKMRRLHDLYVAKRSKRIEVPRVQSVPDLKGDA